MFNDMTPIVNGDNALFMHVNLLIVLNKCFLFSIFYTAFIHRAKLI